MTVTAPKTFQMPPLSLRAAIAPESLDKKNRTVEVIWATGERRRVPGDWYTETHYEQLSLDPAHVKLDRLKSGRAPVLDSHGMDQWGNPLPGGGTLDNVVGVVKDAWIETHEDGQNYGHALLQISARNDHSEEVWAGIVEGTIPNVSIGYRVLTWRDITESEDDLTVLLGVWWEPIEISFVPMGQDSGARVRSADHFHTCKVVIDETQAMTKKSTQKPGAPAKPTPPEDGGAAAAPPANPEGAPAATAAPAAAPAAPAAAAAAPEAPVTGAAAAPAVETPEGDPADLEFQRGQEITAAVEKAGLTRAFADELIQGRVSIDRARALILDKLAEDGEGDPVSTQVRVGDDAAERTRALGVENAILHRIAPDKNQLDDEGRRFRGMSLLEISRDLLEAKGIRTRGMRRDELAYAALSTSDFPHILANVAKKFLGKVFAAADRTFLPLSRQVSFTDFKPRKVVALGDAPALLKVPEGAEITYGSMGEKGETYALATYARILHLTREMLINDDLDAFGRIPRMFGMSAAILENELAWQLWTANTDGVVMGDGLQLFAGGHNNTSTGVLGITGLSNARAKMRAQTSIDGKKMRLRPANLVLPFAHETLGEQLTASLAPSALSEHNPFASAFDNVIVEPLLDDKSSLEYYVTANPDQVDVMEHGYLEGHEGPYIETREGFEREGVEIKCRHDFAVAVIDHRGIVRSSGAA